VKSLPATSSIPRRVLLPLLLAASVLAASVALTIGPASAATGAYVALGDSYASGVGAGKTHGACQRSRRAYAYKLGRDVSAFRACGGATTASLRRHQLAAFPSNTRLVTVTIGGNDAGFVDVIEACLFGAADHCNTRVRKAEKFVHDDLQARLRGVYDAIRERAPHAKVLVVGYPRLFARKHWCSRVGEIGNSEQRRLNEASNLLARTTNAEVARHDGFRFVDLRPAFNGHGVCSAAPRLIGVTSPLTDSFHPTARGQEAYARVIKRRL
jgi:lysophospholipase L1-like esterase